MIKQVDERILHLCGKGSLESTQKRSQLLEDLANGRFQGAVRMGDTGIVLNSRLHAALVPLDQIELENGIADWQGRAWVVSHVPQHCWNFDGQLVTQREGTVDQPRLVSREDVSMIRKHVDTSKAPPGEVVFRPDDGLEDPEK